MGHVKRTILLSLLLLHCSLAKPNVERRSQSTKIDAQNRQGLLSLIRGPGLFGALSLLSLPSLPLLLLAPLALSGVNDAVSSYNENNGALDDLLQTFTGLAQAATGAVGGTGSSGNGGSNKPSSIGAAVSDTMKAQESKPKPVILPAPGSSSSSSSGSSLYSGDLANGFLSQLSAINDILTNLGSSGSGNNSPSTASSLQSMALNAFNSLSSLLFSARGRFQKTNRFANNRNDVVAEPMVIDQLKYNPQFNYNQFSGKEIAMIDSIEKWCHQRVLCELNQKPVRKQLRSWTEAFVNLIGLNRRQPAIQARSLVDSMFDGLRRRTSRDQCLIAYMRCPMASKVAPASVAFQRLKPGWEKQLQMAKPVKHAGPAKPIKALPPKYGINFHGNGKIHTIRHVKPALSNANASGGQWTIMSKPVNAAKQPILPTKPLSTVKP